MKALNLIIFGGIDSFYSAQQYKWHRKDSKLKLHGYLNCPNPLMAMMHVVNFISLWSLFCQLSVSLSCLDKFHPLAPRLVLHVLQRLLFGSQTLVCILYNYIQKSIQQYTVWTQRNSTWPFYLHLYNPHHPSKQTLIYGFRDAKMWLVPNQPCSFHDTFCSSTIVTVLVLCRQMTLVLDWQRERDTSEE